MPVVRTDGRVGGRSVYGHVIIKFSRMGSLPHFLPKMLRCARFARESSAKSGSRSFSGIWVAIPVDLIILHWYACGADRRSGGWAVSVRSRDYQIFSDG